MLGVAVVMLISGETFLKDRLSAHLFLFYWLTCFVLTGLAMITAFRDLRALQERTRQQQRELLETTLKDIEVSARNRDSKLKHNGPGRTQPRQS